MSPDSVSKARKPALIKPRQQRTATVSRPELLVNGSDREFRTFLHGMLSFASRMESIRNGFGKLLGLTGIQYTILISVSYLETEGAVMVSKVAAHLHLSGAFVTIETGKLAQRGLLKKLQDSDDRRRTHLTLTSDGHELLEELLPVQTRVNDALFGFLDRDRFQQLCDLTEPMAACGDRALSLLHYLASDRTADQPREPGAAKVRRTGG